MNNFIEFRGGVEDAVELVMDMRKNLQVARENEDFVTVLKKDGKINFGGKIFKKESWIRHSDSMKFLITIKDRPGLVTELPERFQSQVIN